MNEAQRIENMRAEYAPAWRPQKEGATLIGVLDHYDKAHSRYDDDLVDVANIVQDDGEERAVWLRRGTSLYTEFAKARPRPGERVAVRYFGLRPNRAGTAEYKLFKVAVLSRDPADEVPSFMAESPEPEGEWALAQERSAEAIDAQREQEDAAIPF